MLDGSPVRVQRRWGGRGVPPHPGGIEAWRIRVSETLVYVSQSHWDRPLLCPQAPDTAQSSWESGKGTPIQADLGGLLKNF